jgi:hypothetical protein
MNKTELQEKALLRLLINKHGGEDVNAELVKLITEEFNFISKELKKIEESGKKEKKNPADYFPH